jgi:ribosomal-protein-alanine N-acetyltransferase
MASSGAPANPGQSLPPAAPVVWDDAPLAEELARLDAECFRPAWGIETYQAWSERRDLACWVLRAGSPAQAVGWSVVQRVGAEAEVLRLGVRSAWRGKGWGRRLFEGVRERLRERGVLRIYLEVRAGNLVAQALYRSAGLRQVGRRRGYYQNPAEDAVLMALEEP